MRASPCIRKNWIIAGGRSQPVGKSIIMAALPSRIMAARVASKQPRRKQIHFQTSKLRYFRKHHGNSQYLFLRVHTAAAIQLANLPGKP